MSIDQKDVTSTICEYIKTENTNYAIMISGVWGSGKTYYWKNELQARIEEIGFSTLYVSLNGLDKTEQIARKLVTANWANMTNGIIDVENIEKHKSIFGTVLTAIGSGIKTIAPVADVVNSLVKVDFKPENMMDYIGFKNVVICFDDLERCSDIKKALSFINDFVEHKKTKVIILANEDKKEDEISKVKEKVVGKTIKFLLDKKEILKSIINSYSEDIKDLYLSEIDLIIEMMERSKGCNYRVVKTILDDFYNIYKRNNEFDQECFQLAKKPLLKYIMAVGFEIREKGINKENKELVRNSSEASCFAWEISKRMNNKEGQEKLDPYYVEFKNRYYSIDFEGRYYFPSVFEYIDIGHLDTEKFTEEILRYKEKELTALQYLMNVGYWKMSDADFEARVTGELLTDIENGNIQIGLYPRLFTYFGYFQQNSLINCSLKELEEKFFKGMKVIEQTGKSDYHMDDTPVGENVGEVKLAYERIHDYSDGVRTILRNNHYADKSSQFIEEMKKDIDAAIGIITGIEYHQVPIFTSASVEEIYGILTKSPNGKITNFKHLLTNRYEHRNQYLEDVFKVDYEYMQKLAEHILKELPKDQFTLSQHLLKLLAEDILGKCCKV